MSSETPVRALLLLVEDDDEIRDTLAVLLESRGFDVISARHGQEALDRVRARGTRPDAVILDMQMPVMDGESFLVEQSADPLLAHVPVVVLTAQLLMPRLPPTVRAVLRKPIALSGLLAEVHGALGRSSLPPASLARGTGSVREAMQAIDAEPEVASDPLIPANVDVRERPGSEP